VVGEHNRRRIADLKTKWQ